MSAALNTNAVQALLEEDHLFHEQAIVSLEHLQVQGRALWLCPVVYAECHGIPRFERTPFFRLLQRLGIVLDLELPQAVWERAGEAQVEYHARRRSAGLREPKRVLPDFLIGAHALERGAALLTFDPSGYRKAFPSLSLLPEETDPT